MSLLPTRTNFNQSAASVLTDLKKGDKEKRNEFVWIHQQRFYAIALLATNNPETAEELTVTSFHNVFSALRQINPKQIGMPIWDWLAPFIVDACAQYHRNYSQVEAPSNQTDPSLDGSAQMDWGDYCNFGHTKSEALP